ncbi:MAG: DUF4465 domain-containing protein [Planctomycetota bacterium]
MIRVLNYCTVMLMCCFMVCSGQLVRAESVADFEKLELSPDSYENGKNLSGSFQSGGATFWNEYNTSWESWSGWSYSNVVDTVTPGYDNQYAAYALEGPHGPNAYAVGFAPAEVTLPGRPMGMHVTNTTYAARSILHGDSFAKKFGGESGADPDWFRLTISGRDSGGAKTGSVAFDLADYTPDNNAEDEIVRDWTWVDLSSLDPDTRSLEFSLSSTDVGDWGMNTPAYFAVDNLTTAPEPGSAALCGVALILGFGGYWLRVQRRRA